ncbi:hypothetical protein IF2G_04197 [Cordyceps javanica]|nr:hypothetical protein IF2G_04197 [Cordyceps javanica]
MSVPWASVPANDGRRRWSEPCPAGFTINRLVIGQDFCGFLVGGKPSLVAGVAGQGGREKDMSSAL